MAALVAALVTVTLAVTYAAYAATGRRFADEVSSTITLFYTAGPGGPKTAESGVAGSAAGRRAVGAFRARRAVTAVHRPI